MSDGRINNLDLAAARYNGDVVVEIASKDDAGNVARWRPDVVEYDSTLLPVYKTDFNSKANGNLADDVDFIHHPITAQYNQVVDGDVKGPATSFAMDIINHRVSGSSTYIRAKITTPNNPPIGGQTRLQLRGGNRPLASGSGNQWHTAGTMFITTVGDIRYAMPYIQSGIYRQGFSPSPAVANIMNNFLGVLSEYRPGDEVMIVQQGRSIFLAYNGDWLDAWTLTDDQWTPGYFFSILLDSGHGLSELEVGHWSTSEWLELGDDFNYPDLTKLWNSSPNLIQVVSGVAQSNPVSAIATATYRAYNYSKEATTTDDQIIRAIVVAPVGVTLSATLGVMVVGRAGVDGFTDTLPQVSLLCTQTNGIQISTNVNGVATSRKVESPTVVGTLTFPFELELQCIGNRYYGLVDGNPLIEWIDTTNIVPIGPDRRYYGWSTAVARSNTAYSYSQGIESVKGLTFDVNRTAKPSKLLGLYPPVIPTTGGEVAIVGEGLYQLPALTVGGTPASRVSLHGSNATKFLFPPKAVGTYDVAWNSSNGLSSLLAAIQYKVASAIGKYDPTPTAIGASATVFTKIPLNAETSVVLATVNGVISNLPKGYYRFRTMFTTVYSASEIRHRIVLPAGPKETTFIGSGAASYDNLMDFSVDANGTMELQFARSGSTARSVDPSFDFELILLSATKFPSWIRKLGTYLLPSTVVGTFDKIIGWEVPADFAGTTTIVNDELIVPETGDYTIEWQATFSTVNAANTVRVTNQAGTVIVTKVAPQTMGSQVVTLTKGDSLKLEATTANSSTTARRTVTAATMLRITPVL